VSTTDTRESMDQKPEQQIGFPIETREHQNLAIGSDGS
jgi:hypothetical protein